MATCVKCSRSGFLLSLDKAGLCSTCAQWLTYEAANIGRIVNESVHIINTSKSLDTRLSRCDVLLSLRTPLLKLEHYGKRIIDGPIPAYLSYIEAHKTKLIEQMLGEELEVALSKVATAATTASKVATLSKLAVKVEGYMTHPDAPASLPALQRRIQDAILRAQLDGHLEAAHKAEFKGQKKKALDAYLEALYLLRHDDVDDALQADQIRPIEEKVLSLGGTLA